MTVMSALRLWWGNPKRLPSTAPSPLTGPCDHAPGRGGYCWFCGERVS